MHKLNRREMMGTAAAVGVAATGGSLDAARAAPAAAAVPAVHLDVPYVHVHGAGQAYRAATRSAADAGVADPHELA